MVNDKCACVCANRDANFYHQFNSFTRPTSVSSVSAKESVIFNNYVVKTGANARVNMGRAKHARVKLTTKNNFTAKGNANLSLFERQAFNFQNRSSQSCPDALGVVNEGNLTWKLINEGGKEYQTFARFVR